MAATSVLVENRAPGQSPSETYSLPLPTDRLTVRELIRIYVADQVERHNSTPVNKSSRHESPEERILSPSRIPHYGRQRDYQHECERAIKAFSTNGFFLLVDGAQVTELDAELIITPSTTVSFLRLTPLVGG